MICEMRQGKYIFRCGKTEVNDVIMNLIGTISGYLLYEIMKNVKF